MMKCDICPKEMAGSTEIFVEASARFPSNDYESFVRTLPKRKWIRINLCEGHLREVVEKAEEVMDDISHWQVAHPPLFVAGSKRI